MHLPATEPGPRVLHITQPVDGGVARVVRDLTAAQLAAGLHVTVACPADSELASRLRELGAEVADWQATRSPGPTLLSEVRRLRRVLAAVRPALVHAHSAKAGLAGRLAVRGRVPTVFQPHAWSFEAVGGVTETLALRWERWGARWADRVVCVSEGERERGVRAGVRATWSVVPNGVDTARFRPAPDARAVRAALPQLSSLSGTGSAPLVVCVGRLCRQKGQDVLLDAWPAVVRRVPDARLVLVGDGPEAARLRAAAPEGVLFAGAAPDAVPWYQAADLVVLPSRWEGMALAPLEAMACGRAVVLTEVDGARECLPPRAPELAPVPVGRPEPLADRIAALLLDPAARDAFGAECRAHALTAHDVGRATRAVTELYGELLGGGGWLSTEATGPGPAEAVVPAPAPPSVVEAAGATTEATTKAAEATGTTTEAVEAAEAPAGAVTENRESIHT